MTAQGMTTTPDTTRPAASLHGVPQPHSPEKLWRLLQNPQSSAHGALHLGEALVHAGLLATPALSEGLQAQQAERSQGQHRPIGQILVDRGALTQEQLRNVIATWLGEYTVHPGDITPEAGAAAEIAFTTSGITATCDETDTVLAVAKRSGLNIPSGCTFGLCGTCKVQKLSGEVVMVHNGGISDDEIAAGTILACCSRPQGVVEISL